MKKIFGLLTLLSIAAHANWSDYTYLGTISNVDFSYRTTEEVDGHQVQFRVKNMNNMNARIQISDITFTCKSGQQEVRNSLSFKMKGNEETLTAPFQDVCRGLGGMNYLNVSIDARVRR